MRIPEPGPFGETFFEARERAIAGADFVKRSLGGWVESVVTVFTQRFFEAVFAEDFLAVDRLAEVDLPFPEEDFLVATISAS